MLRIFFSRGISAFEDRRRKKKVSKPSNKQKDDLLIECGDSIITIQPKDKIIIPAKNRLQFKTILLTLLANGIIKSGEAAEALDISTSNIYYNYKKLEEEDVCGLIDKRTGQIKDYIINPEVKAELIQQYALACITNQSTSGNSLSTQLKERCNLDLSDRTIRHHIKKIGLNKIKSTLPDLLKNLKKT